MGSTQPGDSGAATAVDADSSMAGADTVPGLPQHSLPVVGHEHAANMHMGTPMSGLMDQVTYHHQPVSEHMHNVVTTEQMQQVGTKHST